MTSERPNRSVLKDLFILAGLLLAVCAVLWAFSGRMPVEKLLTRLTSPVGVIWLGLISICVIAFRRRQKGIAMAVLVIWVWLTIAGNDTVSNWLLSNLEADYVSTIPTQMDPFDTIIILGGGCRVGPNGEPETNSSGGRVVTAAQMYHAGLVKQFICGGGRISTMTRVRLNESQKAASVLISLGVPQDIVQLGSGENTSREIQDIVQRMESTSNRVGLITSAWHLPRAMRLAKKYGLDVIPIPADFRSPVVHDEPPLFAERICGFIPKAEGLESATVAVKEYLARLVGR